MISIGALKKVKALVGAFSWPYKNSAPPQTGHCLLPPSEWLHPGLQVLSGGGEGEVTVGGHVVLRVRGGQVQVPGRLGVGAALAGLARLQEGEGGPVGGGLGGGGEAECCEQGEAGEAGAPWRHGDRRSTASVPAGAR